MTPYNPENQYRCTIIRGKSQNEIEDLLPAYANIITDICPCDRKIFIDLFNKAIAKFLPSPTEKTIANHRTEITGKLFGMYWEDEIGVVHASARTEQLLENRDNPAFFKDIVSKFQFPNGMDNIQMRSTIDRVQNKIRLRPIAYILKLLLEAFKTKNILTKNEIAYYVLNNLDVLQGKVRTGTVLKTILERRKKGVFKHVEYPGKESSYSMQHITELLNIVELANLIRQKRGNHVVLIYLNLMELQTIEYLSIEGESSPEFDVYTYDLNSIEDKKNMLLDWGKFYAQLDSRSEIFSTTAQSLTEESEFLFGTVAPVGIDTTVIGREGEALVFAREKNRVQEFNTRLVNKVIYFGKQKGLGYDISSIRAILGPKAEHSIYIEVKSTKRITRPKTPLKDQFDLTRNEWVAAEQHKNNYYIHRVYFTNEGPFVFVINNPVQQRENGTIYAEPLKYHIEFTDVSGLWEP
jgi:hypothetical protein